MPNDLALGTGLLLMFLFCWICAGWLTLTDHRAIAAAVGERRTALMHAFVSQRQTLAERRIPRAGWIEFRAALRSELRRCEAANLTPVPEPEEPLALPTVLPPLYLYRVVDVATLAETMTAGWNAAGEELWTAETPRAVAPRAAVLKVRANEALGSGVQVDRRGAGWYLGATPARFFEFFWTLSEARDRL